MALVFYDEDKVAYGSLATVGPFESGRQGPHRTFIDGRLGGAHEQVIYIRNDDANNYYTSITLGYEHDNYADLGEFGATGWGVKFLYGERRPTEAEWDAVSSGEDISVPNIGDTSAGDTTTYHPVWIRVYCPGNAAAHIRENQRLRVKLYERLVGT